MADPTGGPQYGLVTQGTVDWTSMGQSALGFGGSVLQRLANADIQPATLIAAHHIASLFQLSNNGRRLVQEAVSTLPCYSALGDALFFGFGLRHPVRSLGEQDRGQRILALCSCLASVLSIVDCADVLYALAQGSQVPDEFRPSPQQWVNLLKACGGVLRTTNFSTVAGHFMSLSHREIQHGRMDNHKAVAKALLALFQVSSGQDVSVSVAGGRLCGWMAAFGKEILGFEVQIHDDEGSLLYQSTDVEHDVKLSVHYQAGDSSASCIVSGRSYFIDSLKSIINDQDAFAHGESVISGTVEWDRCLRLMAGDDFQQIFGPDSNFAHIISLTGRILEGVSKHEGHDFLQPSLYKTWPAYHPRQYGSGFMRSAAEWFPELVYLREAPYHARHMSIDDAVNELVQFIYQPLEHLMYQSVEDLEYLEEGPYAPDEFNLEKLLEPDLLLRLTVLFLTWNLSFLRVDERLEPYETGFDWARLYIKRQLKQHVEALDLPYVPTIRDIKSGVLALLNLLKIGSVYYTAKSLFSLDTVSHDETAFAAISAGGLCFYFDILGRVSDEVEAITTLHVLRGSIETSGGRTFNTITNLTGSRDWRCMELSSIDQGSNIDDRTYDRHPEFHKSYTSPQPAQMDNFQGRWGELGRNTGTQGLRVDLIVDESTRGLRADLCFRSDQGECRVGVYTMLLELIISTGQVPRCDHENALQDLRLHPTFLRVAYVVDSEGNIPGGTPSHGIYIFRLSGNELARCIALLVNRKDCVANTILRRAECIPCCIKTASRGGPSPVFRPVIL